MGAVLDLVGQKTRSVVFLTETRADYGKLKSLIRLLCDSGFDTHIFVCGMHLLPKYGSTYLEIIKDGFKNIYLSEICSSKWGMDLSLAHVISEFSRYLKNMVNVDLVVIHGDRIGAFGGAIVGALNNIRVAHIEGGEISGSIDESIRHSISKLAHIHFVCNSEARNRLIQLGENADFIFEIGSPDIDVMLSPDLPDIDSVKLRYGIDFSSFAIFIYHPVTTASLVTLKRDIQFLCSVLKESGRNFVVIFPNNDVGSHVILKEISKLNSHPNFRIFPSVRFECFLTLLRHCDFIIGNSSCGVRESCVYGVPSIDVGDRQDGRYDKNNPLITHVESNGDILGAIRRVCSETHAPFSNFGNGTAGDNFLKVLCGERIWQLNIQKKFVSLYSH